MKPRIVLLNEKKLLGISLKMNLLQNKTFELWSKFMPRRKEIKNSISNQLYSMQVYDKSLDFSNFTPETIFEKWATVEVLDFSKIPEGMQPYTLKGGLYAVFDYKGAASEFQSTFQYIFNEWFPSSDYQVDNREHFEILGDKYKNNDPDSEEEIWIPIIEKAIAVKH